VSWDVIAAISEFVSAVAVVVSLLYVGAQIRQANLLSRANTFQSVNYEYGNIVSMAATDAELARISRAVRMGEELPPDEFERYINFLRAYFAWLENLYVQQSSGLFAVDLETENAVEFMKGQFNGMLASSQAQEWLFGEGKDTLSPDFYAEVERRLEAPLKPKELNDT